RPKMFLNVFHPRHPDLFAVGLVETEGAAFPLLDLQARLVAEHLLDQSERPEQAEALRLLAKTGSEPRPRHSGGPRHPLYVPTREYANYARRLLRRLERGKLKRPRSAR